MAIIVPGKAIKAEVGKAKTGNYQVAIEFYVLGGQYNGHSAMFYGALVGKAIPITMEALKHCGCTDLTRLGDVRKNKVRLTLEDNEGKLQVKYVNELDRALFKSSATPAELKSLQTFVQSELERPKPERMREPGEDDIPDDERWGEDGRDEKDKIPY